MNGNNPRFLASRLQLENKNSPRSRFKLLFSSYPRTTLPVGFDICESAGKLDVSLAHSTKPFLSNQVEGTHQLSPCDRFNMTNRPYSARVRSNDLGYHKIPAGQRGSSYERQKGETNEGGHCVEQHVGSEGVVSSAFLVQLV